jgi:hypothetical protein
LAEVVRQSTDTGVVQTAALVEHVVVIDWGLSIVVRVTLTATWQVPPNDAIA